MMEYILIENTEYRLIIVLEDKELDYYTDVYIKFISDKNSIVLFKDNLLALKALERDYSGKIKCIYVEISLFYKQL